MSKQYRNLKQIEDLEAGKWITFEVKVEQLWENNHESIRQVGLLSDDTGIVKFVSWEKSNLPLLEEGVTYVIGKVPVTEFEDNFQVSMVKTTKIERVADSQAELPEEPEHIPTV